MALLFLSTNFMDGVVEKGTTSLAASDVRRTGPQNYMYSLQLQRRNLLKLHLLAGYGAPHFLDLVPDMIIY